MAIEYTPVTFDENTSPLHEQGSLFEVEQETQPQPEASIFRLYPEVAQLMVSPDTDYVGSVEHEAQVFTLDIARSGVDEALNAATAFKAPVEITGTVPYATFSLPHREASPVKGEKAPKFKVRQATREDIPAIVDVDMRAFDSVYRDYNEDADELRAQLTEKFEGRFEKVGGEWMPLLERDGKVVGFMTCCPTSKSPEDFKSWEDTTDNGTLETTYDPEGENVYIVTLSVLAAGSPAKDRLFADQIGKMFREGYKLAFFESRMPGLRNWVDGQAKQYGTSTEDLDSQHLNYMADVYFNLKSEVGGREVRYDRLLRLYEKVGCKFLKVVPNAYRDEPSMDYGVVCVYDGSEFFDGSLLPVKLPDNKVTRKVLAYSMATVSKSQKLTNILFG